MSPFPLFCRILRLAREGLGCMHILCSHAYPGNDCGVQTRSERFIVVCRRAVNALLWCVDTLCNPDAKRLYDDLLRRSGYNKLIRPVRNNSECLTVRLGLRLSQLIDVVCGATLHVLVYLGLPWSTPYPPPPGLAAFQSPDIPQVAI